MDRRKFNFISLLAPAILLAQQRAYAFSISDLTNIEASQGLKTALERGAVTAVNLLGKTDGFLGNEKVRIALPGYLEDASQLLRMMGQGVHLDELVTAMNRAAEAAVPMAKDLLIGAIRSMNVMDARQILTGGETAITTFFAEKTRLPLSARFLPVVTEVTAKVGLAEKYNQIAGKAANFGLIKKEEANIQQYVTDKSLDGLFVMIGEEEKKIRQDPMATGSAILKKVFGSLN